MRSLSDPLHTLLLHHAWASAFDARTLERGRDYAECGRVLDLGEAPGPDGSIELRGRIAGSARHVYECQVKLNPRGRSLVADARCTCPVEFDCKHAAAMLFAATPELMEYDEDLDVTSHGSAPLPGKLPFDDARVAMDTVRLTQWQHWLSNLEQPPIAGSHASPEQSFGVLLRALALDRLAVLPAWLRPSKRANAQGALVDPRPVTLDERRGAVPTPADGWSNDDANALTTILHAPTQFIGNQHWFEIASPFVEQALEGLLARYPAYFERGSVPLQRGAAVAAAFAWHESGDGRQKLVMTDGALAGCHVLRGEGYWYIDPANRKYGRIDGDSRLLRQLQYAPELTPDAVAMAREQLANSSLSRRIPSPVARERGPDINVAPTPVLHLGTQTLQERWNFQRHRVAFGWLAFDYAGAAIEAVPPIPMVLRIVDGRICVIRRNSEAESAALRALQLAGLGLLTNDSGYILPADAPPLAHAAWILRANRNRPPAGPEAWKDVIEILEGQGFLLEYGNGFPRLEVLDAGEWHAELTPSGNHWFDVSLGIEVNGKRVDLLPLLRQLVADPAFPRKAPKREKAGATWRVFLDATHCVDLPLTHLRALIEPLLEWLESESSGTPRVHATELGGLNDRLIPWRGGEALRAQLANLERARKPQVPRSLKATLRPYQLDGLAWLDFLAAADLGGILADDMGLGKTLQVLAHVLGEKQRKRLPHPVLAIVPTSLVGNWASEAARFTPTLKVLVIHGSERKGTFARIPRHDLVITTYPLLRQDRDQLLDQTFSLLVLDEAQTIKNAHSQAARIVRELSAGRRIALTGTPMENHLGELWAEFDAVEPGLLGSERQFQRVYRTPIEKHGDTERQQRLNRRVGALLLRRRKEDVLTDLPPKTEMVRSVALEGAQRELYETLRLAQHERIREAVQKRGFAQAGIIVLDALLKLRQVCCDPRLVKLASARKVHASAKLDALLELVEQATAEGRRVLVFSQFTEMLGLVETVFKRHGIDYQTLTGQTAGSHRAAIVKRFQSGKVPVFLISLKAGGLGLNLTAADTVIHYDPWWNPAVEAQATDRAHRIGQDKPVFVYRLICAGTVEEKIQALQARKAKLARAILEGGSSQQLRFNEADLDALFGAGVTSV